MAGTPARIDWDYTDLAEFYQHRPSYAQQTIDTIVSVAALKPGDPVCDIGAGTGHLTVELLGRGLRVTAVEPNDAMRERGERRTGAAAGVAWVSGVGEETGQPSEAFRLTSFGSSFNVVRQAEALREAHRILQPGGWFACLWNHRDLDDPLQSRIEGVIRREIPAYDYGKRREDPSATIVASGLFVDPQRFEARVQHTLPAAQFVEGWRSHATLKRQAGDRFDAFLEELRRLVTSEVGPEITVPYVTRLWMAARR